MQADFWLQCWQHNQLGFQLEQPHPLLCLRTAVFPAGAPVFVPLCGKTPDMHLLAKQGQVIGAELSAIACRDFFQEAQLNPNQITTSAFVIWQAAQYTLWQGDFFELPVTAVGDCRFIYDRAALIALPADMRRAYVDKLRQLFASATLLLISLEYPPDEKIGPPFEVNAAAVHELFAFAHVELLSLSNITGQGFARRRFQTSTLVEKSWLIKW